MTENPNPLIERIEHLKLEHRDLDEIIDGLIANPSPNLIQIQRLKKRKLVLKDLIARMCSQLIPDIIA